MFWNKKRAAEKAVMEITKKIAKLMVYTELAVLATGLPAKEIIKILGEEDLVEAFDNGKLAPYYKDAEKVSVAIDTIAAINQNNNQLDSFATIKTLKEIFNSTAEKIILEVHHTPGPKNNPVMIMHPMMARFLLPKKVLAALEKYKSVMLIDVYQDSLAIGLYHKCPPPFGNPPSDPHDTEVSNDKPDPKPSDEAKPAAAADDKDDDVPTMPGMPVDDDDDDTVPSNP